MKYIKTFEQNISKPEVGDYIVLHFDTKNNMITQMLQKYIGQITEEHANFFIAKFGTTTWRIEKKDVADFSKNKKDLEYLIVADKLNL